MDQHFGPIEFSGTQDPEGLSIYRKPREENADYAYSIPLAFSDDPNSPAGAIDISADGKLMGIELIGVERAIEIAEKARKNNEDNPLS